MKRAQRPPTALMKRRTKQVMKLYSKGCTLRQVADALGLALSGFTGWLQIMRDQQPEMYKQMQKSRRVDHPRGPVRKIPASLLPARLDAEEDGVRELSVTLPDSLHMVVFRLPVPMSAADYGHLLELIKALKPALTRPRDPVRKGE